MRNYGYKRYDREEPYFTWQFGKKKINKPGIVGIEDYMRDYMIAILLFRTFT
mgnify:CR=1 FL=1